MIELFAKPKRQENGIYSFWQRIFALSKVNNAPYHGESLPVAPRKWPDGTFLRTRLEYLRREEG
jgi:hypothetical protein